MASFRNEFHLNLGIYESGGEMAVVAKSVPRTGVQVACILHPTTAGPCEATSLWGVGFTVQGRV